MNPTRPLCAAALLCCLGACASAPTAPLPRCTAACQTHADGYTWAQRGSLSDSRQCEGYPAAFRRGCLDAITDYQHLQPAAKGW